MKGYNDMKFRFNKPVQAIMENCGVNQYTLGFAVGEVRKLMYEFVPMDTGNLADSADEVLENSSKGCVVYTAPYARFCYYGERLRFSREKNPKACAFWDRAMMQVYKGELYARVNRFIKKK